MAVRVARRRTRDRPRGPVPPAPSRIADRGAGALSPHLAPRLTVLGGALAVLGALGTWVRATEVAAQGALPQEVARVVGATEPTGWALAALGAVAIVGATTWRLLGLVPKVGVVLASLGLIGFGAWWLVRLDERASAMAAAAAARPDFVTYSASFGWGAWLLLVGGSVLGLAVAAGLLRELEVRRGRP